jgi:hypothetical protein
MNGYLGNQGPSIPNHPPVLTGHLVALSHRLQKNQLEAKG